MINKKIGIFIPGRLSSERLPNKLVLPLGRSNLWDMACGKLSTLGDKFRIFALCEEGELSDIASNYNNIEVVLRGHASAAEDGPLVKIFEDLKGPTEECTHLMFLNPCLSFLKAETIRNAIDWCTDNNVDFMTSVKPYKNWLFDKSDVCLTSIDYHNLNTKLIDGFYEAAHCFHFFKRDKFFESSMMLGEGMRTFTVNRDECIDIDDKADYEMAKVLHSKKYVIDIDGVICETNGTDYAGALPVYKNINKFNSLHKAGNKIIYFTSRGYESGIDWSSLTLKQFHDWNVLYDRLLFGKPSADIYIDDKCICKPHDFYFVE